MHITRASYQAKHVDPSAAIIKQSDRQSSDMDFYVCGTA